ncbi:MAG: hypothetical protein D6820_03870 [Lentisphaerae bacterium]|nr:MAG: hypothetical protein D6820_03870 [Lentisphaerota bacterium]
MCYFHVEKQSDNCNPSLVGRGATLASTSLQAGRLRLELDDTGKIVALEDIVANKNYIVHAKEQWSSYLLRCRKYGTNEVARPCRSEIIERDESSAVFRLSFENMTSIDVRIAAKNGYFRMEIVAAVPLKEISDVFWGPIRTTMRGPIAKWVGLNRSEDFTIGLIPLELNTDAPACPAWCSGNAAQFEAHGALLQLATYDHTRDRFIPGDGFDAEYRKAKPLPNVTVVGSAVALFGCPRGKNSELEMIEQIELAEGLPHPTFKGEWVKRSWEVRRPAIWIPHSQSNMAECIRIAAALHAGSLCRFHGFYQNWGHFDLDKDVYPGGIEALKADSQKVQAHGMFLENYTLTFFLKPVKSPEPWIAPIPDPRLMHFAVETRLAASVEENTSEIPVIYSKEVEAIWKRSHWKVIQIDNEMIEFGSYERRDGVLLLKKLIRGAFMGKPASHAENAKVKLMQVGGYHNFFPGTLDMYLEMARNQAMIDVRADLGKLLLDGFGASTGHGNYAKNLFLKTCYDLFVDNGKEVIFTTSPTQSVFAWHYIGYFSWGEFDHIRGFRGTMLDYRLRNQIEMQDNLIPNKLGQYYLRKDTSVEDIEWLLGLSAGWDAGFELCVEPSIRNHAAFTQICELIGLWEEAKAKAAFTDKQKMQLRQTDTVHTLLKRNGRFELKLKKHWRYRGLRIRPAAELHLLPVNGGPASIAPCGIDWSWTHNPGIFREVWLSDDMIYHAGTKAPVWRITVPPPTPGGRDVSSLFYIIRVPEDAPCGVRDIQITLHGNLMTRVPVVLYPGQYVSRVHDVPMVCVYDANHRVIREARIPQFNPYWYVPEFKKGTTTTVSLTCVPLDAEAKPEVRMNLRFHSELTEANVKQTK